MLFLLCFCGSALTLELDSLHFMRGDETLVSSYLGTASQDQIISDSSGLAEPLSAKPPPPRFQLSFVAITEFPILFTVIGAIFLLLCGLGSIRRRVHGFQRKAEQLLENNRKALSGHFRHLPRLLEETSLIEQNSLHFTGKTERLTGNLLHEVGELERIESSVGRQLRNAETLIHPASPGRRFTNFFSSGPYLQAIDLLNSESIAASEDTNPMSPAQLITLSEEGEQRAAALLSRLKNGIYGLPELLKQAGGDLEKISKLLSHISKQCHLDGFFPLVNVQTKLIPSAETLLDESARIGATDPVSAVENPAKLAARQIADALLLTESVKNLRSLSFPGIRAAVKSLDAISIRSEWIDREYFDHSRTLETFSERAVLWSIAERFRFFLEELETSKKRIFEAGDLASRIRKTTIPAITLMEQRVADQCREIGSLMNLSPGEILREGELDPASQIAKARHALALIKDSLGRGNPSAVAGQLSEIDEIIGETGQLLLVSNNVLDHYEASRDELSIRLDQLRKKLPGVETTFAKMEKNYLPDVLQLRERFGAGVSPRGSISSAFEVSANGSLTGIEDLLRNSQIAFNRGKLLTAGRQIEKANSEINFVGQQMDLVLNQGDALSRAEEGNGKTLGELRWRHRSLIAKVDDHRTRKRSVDRHGHLQQLISRIEADLNSELKDPLKIENQLVTMKRTLHELEDSVAMDWFWHEFATDSIKSAARTLRGHSSIVEGLKEEELLNPAKLHAATARFATLKDQLEGWQLFLEEKHLDWKEAFDAGVNLEAESAETVYAIKGDAKTIRASGQLLKTSAQQIGELLNWENPYQVSLDREAGVSFFSRARSALKDIDRNAVAANSAIVSQQVAAALNRASSLEQRAKTRVETEKRQTAHNLLNPSFVYIGPEHHMTIPLTAPLPHFGFSGHREASKGKINGHSNGASDHETKVPPNGAEKTPNGSYQAVGQSRPQPKSLTELAN